MNINLLRDADDDCGFYVSACATSPLAAWLGAALFESSDGTNYTLIKDLPTEATLGYTTSVLGNFLSGNIPDELNSVNVVLSNGSLSSITYDSLLLGNNLCVIGDEIMCFRTATLETNGSYTLRGFLRGQRGSEYAMPLHAVADRFILVNSAVLRVVKDSSAIGATKQYKGISAHDALANVTAKSFTNEGVGKKPYAPVHLGGGRDSSGNITIMWTRRSRLDGSWRDNVDVPLSEASEAYSVVIYDGSGYSTIKRTIDGLTSPTCPYSAADQTTDFGSPQSTVYFKVYQLSAVVGRGHAALGSV